MTLPGFRLRSEIEGEIWCLFPERVPDLEFRYPECPVCDDGTELSHDAGWYCETCGHGWYSDGTRGAYEA